MPKAGQWLESKKYLFFSPHFTTGSTIIRQTLFLVEMATLTGDTVVNHAMTRFQAGEGKRKRGGEGRDKIEVWTCRRTKKSPLPITVNPRRQCLHPFHTTRGCKDWKVMAIYGDLLTRGPLGDIKVCVQGVLIRGSLNSGHHWRDNRVDTLVGVDSGKLMDVKWPHIYLNVQLLVSLISSTNSFLLLLLLLFSF